MSALVFNCWFYMRAHLYEWHHRWLPNSLPVLFYSSHSMEVSVSRSIGCSSVGWSVIIKDGKSEHFNHPKNTDTYVCMACMQSKGMRSILTYSLRLRSCLITLPHFFLLPYRILFKIFWNLKRFLQSIHTLSNFPPTTLFHLPQQGKG